MRIAYLINQYPMVSHSFIRREILALERQGFEVMRISLRGWDRELVDPEDQRERKRTRYVLSEGTLSLMLAVMRMLFTRPVRFMRALALACRMGRRAERPLPVHFAYLAEACRIEPWLTRRRCSARACALRHQLGRGSDAGACAGRAPVELHGPRPNGIREAALYRPGRENSPLCVRRGHQLVWPQPALPFCGTAAVAQGASGALRTGR